MKPSKDPKADELRNSNISEPKESRSNLQEQTNPVPTTQKEEEVQNGAEM